MVNPFFGGSYFNFQDNSFTKRNNAARCILEYKKNASPRLTYDADQDMIIYEHLVSETGEPSKKYTYIPDGDYEGLSWKDGKWVHIEKVFSQKTPEGQEPVPHPILDAQGKIDETKLSTKMPDSNNSMINEETDSITVSKANNLPQKKSSDN